MESETEATQPPTFPSVPKSKKALQTQQQSSRGALCCKVKTQQSDNHFDQTLGETAFMAIAICQGTSPQEVTSRDKRKSMTFTCPQAKNHYVSYEVGG